MLPALFRSGEVGGAFIWHLLAASNVTATNRHLPGQYWPCCQRCLPAYLLYLLYLLGGVSSIYLAVQQTSGYRVRSKWKTTLAKQAPQPAGRNLTKLLPPQSLKHWLTTPSLTPGWPFVDLSRVARRFQKILSLEADVWQTIKRMYWDLSMPWGAVCLSGPLPSHLPSRSWKADLRATALGSPPVRPGPPGRTRGESGVCTPPGPSARLSHHKRSLLVSRKPSLQTFILLSNLLC